MCRAQQLVVEPAMTNSSTSVLHHRLAHPSQVLADAEYEIDDRLAALRASQDEVELAHVE